MPKRSPTELNRPLLVESLAGVRTGWQSRVEQAFRDARNHNAVLLFDDADAWMAGDDPETTDMARGLLSRVERFEGVVILASRVSPSPESSFGESFAYRIALPFPDAAARADIWSRLIPDTVPTEGFLDFESLGDTYALSGREIRQAVFRVVLQASSQDGAVTMKMLRAAASKV